VDGDSKVGGIFSFVPADTHLSGGLTSVPGFHGLSSTPGAGPGAKGGTAEGHEFSFSPNYSVHQAAGGRSGRESQFSTRSTTAVLLCGRIGVLGPGDKDPNAPN
jgi:hypothetical protein